MSGGVGPTCGGGITLPSTGAPLPPLHPTPTSPTARPHHHYYLFSIKQLNSFGAAAVLAFSTTVPLSDIAFALLVIPYLVVLSVLAFPQRPGKPNPGAPVFLGRGRFLLRAHDALGFLVGAALPALYILDGLRSGDTAGVAAASPHAFLLAAQIFTEGLAAAWPGRFLPPPVVAGRVLAVANLAYWGINLFAFLLPFYLPKAFNRYYCGSDSKEDDATAAAGAIDADDAKKKDS
ncbi:hypothetical protein OsJ_32361 [Oryza sativa Japonica Group]|uniref:DUF7733 domain-containing protein n=1 Tax=Oryza sativa subsp. japonica TaxID=39947 RepID=A3C722_ORYSJ|nr:hypothetical protein OsJ_32361 [Oryza sativa Japonica Group]